MNELNSLSVGNKGGKQAPLSYLSCMWQYLGFAGECITYRVIIIEL